MRFVGGHIGEQIDLAAKLNEKSAVLRRDDHVVEKDAGGGALGAERVALSGAGLDKDAHGERVSGSRRKGGNGSWVAVVGQGEVALGEVGDELSILIKHRDGCGDLRGCGRRRLALREERAGRGAERNGEKRSEDFRH